MLAAMRDSSLDHRTYWLRNGQYYGRDNLGDVTPACVLPPDKLAQIPAEDRQIVIEDANADPDFCAKLYRCMTTQADWAHLIANSAKEAIVNELDPSRFGNRVGQWRMLRARVRDLLKDVPGLVDKIAKYRAAGRQAATVTPPVMMPDKTLPRPVGLGQFDVIAGLVSAVVGAGASVYSAELQSSTQKDLAKMQADAAMKAAQSQMATLQARQALAAQNPIGSMITNLATGSVAGIPLLLIVPAIGAAIYFATKK